MAERPRTYTYEPPAGGGRSNAAYETRTVPIYSARPVASEISLDRQGFAVHHHRSAVHDFYDDDEVREVYYPEAQRVLTELTGADRVFVFDHTQRRRINGGGRPAPPATAPAPHPHSRSSNANT